MNFLLRTRLVQASWRGCAHAALVWLLAGCASAPLPDIATQRFEAAYRSGSEKFAAGDLAQAASAFAQAERMAALYDRRAMRLQALLSQATVAAVREQDTAALAAYTQAQAEARGQGDAHSEAVARVGVAEVQRRAGDHALALQGFDLALQTNALRADSAERLQARMGQALAWNASGKSTAARDAMQVLEAQLRASAPSAAPGNAIGNSDGKGNSDANRSALLSAVLANQAVLLRETGNVPAAIAKAEEALALNQRLANPSALAADLELLGSLYRLRGNADLARANFQRALRIVEATGQARSLQRLQQLLR